MSSCGYGGNKRITKRLRQIRNAWQFWFESALVFTAQCFMLGGSVAHYLTRRYATRLNFNISSISFYLAIRFLFRQISIFGSNS